jgi:hypothetical protein
MKSFSFLDSIQQDIRYCFRMMRKSPTFMLIPPRTAANHNRPFRINFLIEYATNML